MNLVQRVFSITTVGTFQRFLTAILVVASVTTSLFSAPTLAQERDPVVQSETAVIHASAGSPLIGDRLAVVTEFQGSNPDAVANALAGALNPVDTRASEINPANTPLLASADSQEAAERLANAIPKSFWKRAILLPVGALARMSQAATVMKSAGQSEWEGVRKLGVWVGTLTIIRIAGGTYVNVSLTQYAEGAQWAASALAGLLTYLWTYHDAFVTRGMKYLSNSAQEKLDPDRPFTPSWFEKFLNRTRLVHDPANPHGLDPLFARHPILTNLAGSWAFGTATTLAFAAVYAWDQVIPQFAHPEVWWTFTKALGMSALGTFGWFGWNELDTQMRQKNKTGEISDSQIQKFRLFRSIQSAIVGLGAPLMTELMFPGNNTSPTWLHNMAVITFAGNAVIGHALNLRPSELIAKLKSQPWYRRVRQKTFENSVRLSLGLSDLLQATHSSAGRIWNDYLHPQPPICRLYLGGKN